MLLQFGTSEVFFAAICTLPGSFGQFLVDHGCAWLGLKSNQSGLFNCACSTWNVNVCGDVARSLLRSECRTGNVLQGRK